MISKGNLSDNAVFTIIITIVLGTSVGILVLRDRWRDHVGMPQSERKRYEQNLIKWEMVIAQLVIGVSCVISVAHAIIGLVLLISAYFTWRNGWPPWKGAKLDRK